MNPGKLNKRITIQQETVTDDGMGGQEKSWTDVCKVWANVNPLSVGETFKAQVVETQTTHKITIRFRKGLDAKMRVIYNNRKFNITSLIDKEEKHVELTLLCSELVQDGD